MLYRKYRPKSFAECRGLELIVKTLVNSVTAGKVAHAYLLSGPRGTGKTTIARILAKVENCEDVKSGDACGVCGNCQAIERGEALDVIEIDAASNTQVEKIRDLIEKVRFTPAVFKKKVYIIDEVHMLSSASFNALLKTLEEPPEHAMFILATTDPQKVPDTIISRVQHFSFSKINTDEIAKHLAEVASSEGIEINEEAAQMIAEASDGSFRDALSLFEQVLAIGVSKVTSLEVESALGIPDFKAVVGIVSSLADKNLKEAITATGELSAQGFDIYEFTKALVGFLRKVLIFDVTGKSQEISVPKQQIVATLAKNFDRSELIELVANLNVAVREMRKSPVPEAVLEMVIFEFIKSPSTVIDSTQHVILSETKDPIDSVPTVIASPDKTLTANHSPLTTHSSPLAPSSPKDEFKWEEFLMEVKSQNHTIHAFLVNSDQKLIGDILNIYFDYKFYKDKIEETKNKAVVENALEKIYGRVIVLKCTLNVRELVSKESEPKADLRQDLVESVAEIFGGEVVE